MIKEKFTQTRDWVKESAPEAGGALLMLGSLPVTTAVGIVFLPQLYKRAERERAGARAEAQRLHEAKVAHWSRPSKPAAPEPESALMPPDPTANVKIDVDEETARKNARTSGLKTESYEGLITGKTAAVQSEVPVGADERT